MSLHRLVNLLIIGCLLLAAVAFFMSDRLPAPQRLHAALQDEPLQSPTRDKPFEATVDGVDYRIEPRFAYDISGLVVSLHASDTWWDYAHKEWNDKINLADLCVVWGENIRREAYRSTSFSNDQWTCFWSTSSNNGFDATAFSNNHLITSDPAHARTLRRVRVGDEVRVRGYLADYTTLKNGAPAGMRKTSVVRTDDGQGACEVIWIQEIEILRAANRPWRLTLRVALVLLLLSVIAWVLLPPRLSD